VPLLASIVPVVGAVVLWLVTGSLLALWLAALGPLIAGATMLDGRRGARRDRKRANAKALAARERVSREVGARHTAERERRWARHPNVAAFVARDGDIWRSAPGRDDLLVVGAGVEASAVRVIGGGDDPESKNLRARAARLDDAPVVVPTSAGIAVAGSPVAAAAAMRALVLQLCMVRPPGELRIIGPLRGENAWAEALPHRRAATGVTLALGTAAEPPPGADISIVRAAASDQPPPRCAVVLTVHSPGRATVDIGGEVRDISVEAVGSTQAEGLAAELAARAVRLLDAAGTSEPVTLAPLLAGAPSAMRGRLPAVIGVEAGDPFLVDLIADGPHAVVAGVTGSGKSELLITWILALCATHTTRDVSFLLADFKGGTAFDALSEVPHVTGVMTDLDGSGARRALESLRAEVRWREAELARAGARDIQDPRVELPRLVVVVDEFAALLAEHPELHAVFTDVAARGRALGIHLVLGTQRPSGVVRESLLANCPLRISLRVTDASDSRAIIGTDQAAALPGGPGGRGLALVRTASDPSPRRVRIALSSVADRRGIAAAETGPRPRRPWLPDLPHRIDLADLRPLALEADGSLLLGLADEPDRQQQRPVGVSVQRRGVLVIGSGGSGKSTALRTLAAQAPNGVVWVPAQAEAGWDAVAALSDRIPPPGTLVALDDLDALCASLPPDYGRELVERLERVLRSAGAAEVLIVASTQRLGGAVARLAELLPTRLVLATPSRSEHIAAGGDPAHWSPGAPPGRGRLEGRAIQVATTPHDGGSQPQPAEPWHPRNPLTGFVMRRSPFTRAALTAWELGGNRILSLDEFAGETDRSGAPVVVAGDGDEWQRHWRALAAMRSDHDLVVDASCASELRVLTGERAMPPYCAPGLSRAWLLHRGAAPQRIALPS
ncbi:FtsK/SpoIIIE domain-containing protein, partial [Microbacterium sp.]|uniref:FtsK/SpoIIIE domain-containing protein n=1 Tax=Microbacterium sp. TaxID=51671 RepID=UPI002E3419DC